MLRFILMLTAAFFLSFFAPPAQAWSTKTMNKVIDQTNFVVGGNCSGTLINLEKRLILTAAHCVEDQYVTKERELISNEGVVTKEKYRQLVDGNVSQLEFKDGITVRTVSYQVRLKAVDKDIDLAVVQVTADLPNAQAAKLASEEPERGDKAYVIGNPMGSLYSSVHVGVVSSMDRTYGTIGWPTNPTGRIMQVSGGVIGGNSGGAVYNDEGELIGVPVVAHRNNEVLGFAVPLGVIKKFLIDNRLD